MRKAIIVVAVLALAYIAGAQFVAGPDANIQPTEVAGSDGTNLRKLSVDTSGRPQMVGAGAAGAAVAGNPVLICGSDGTNCQTVRVNAKGALLPGSVGTSVADADADTTQFPRYFDEGVNGAVVTRNANREWIFNGTAWDRWRSASLANTTVATTLTARNSIGAILAEKGSRWTVVSAPASGTVASASIAAEVGVRHVVDCVTFSASASAAVTAANGTVVVRDGATGAGTIIWPYAVAVATAAAAGVQVVAPQHFCGLNLVGTTNTAMTAEFNAGVTGATQAVAISGYNLN